jgi:hypothetical protein
MSLGREGIELAAAHLDQRKLGGHEEAIKKNEERDGAQPEKDYSGRIPLLGDGFGQRKGGEKDERQRIHGTDARLAPEYPRSRIPTSSIWSHPG